MITLENVSFSYGNQMILKHVNCHFKAQRTTAIIGYSGSGKTTLLHVLAGLVKESSGRIVFSQEASKSHTGLVMQDYGLFPWKTVLDNVALGLLGSQCSIKEARKKAQEVLGLLGISDLSSAYPLRISGGQKQRVAIARTLIQKPSIVLLDEASSALDALSKESLQELILNLHKREQFTLIFVTHSIEEAVYLGHEVMIVADGSVVHTFENPMAGTEHYRQSETFYKNCSAVRAALEGGGRYE